MSLYPFALRVLAALVLLTAGASSQLITGRVVDAFNQPVPGVDIDAELMSTGDDVVVVNGGTDLNGNFAATLPGAGNYRIIFRPPPPPASTSLVTEVENVVVITSTNMGTTALLPGVALSGRVVNPAMFPVAGVDLDVVGPSGDQLDIVGDTTDLAGNFNIAVPSGPIEFRVDTSGFSPPLAAYRADLVLTGNTGLGDIQLQQGFVVTAVMTSPFGPVESADADAIDIASGVEVFTPGDNSNASGQFSFIVPAGTYEFEFCPQFDDGLVATTVAPVAVAGNINLGTVAVQAGHVLSGTIRDGSGTPVQGVDVDVRFAGSATEVTLCGDNTNASGQYAVIVPTGSFDLNFEPPYALPLGAANVSSVGVGGPTVQNVILPECAFYSNYGVGVPGSGGIVPRIFTSGGAPRPGNSGFTIEIADGVGGGTIWLILGFAPAQLFFKDVGNILVDLGLAHYLIPLPNFGTPGVPGAGALSVSAPLPDDPILIGISFYGQAVFEDVGAPALYSMSDGLQVTFCE